MLAPNPRDDAYETGQVVTIHSPSPRTDGAAMARLMDVLSEASTAFMVRLPPMAVPAIKPEHIMAEILQRILVEPCDVQVVPFDAATIVGVVTPRTQQPFDPLHVNSLLELFRRGLDAALGLPEDRETGEHPLIVPVACVAPVGGLQENLAALNQLLETIVNKRLRVQFQPIVSFAAGRVFGYEALIRLPQDGQLKRAGEFFNAADHARVVSWLDIACQEECFKSAARVGLRDYLFINMDAEGLAYLHMAERSLADRAAELNIPPSRVVLEITERQAVEDFPRLIHYIEGLRAQGFKIAIDDAGAGYSSLHAIAELRPDFVKIDRSLVRCIENNGTRRALLGALARYAMQIGASVVAEGIETRDELATIIELGVQYGQGYLLGRPNDGFNGLRREMRETVAAHLVHRQRRAGGHSYPIGEMARKGITMAPDTLCELAVKKFTKNPDLETIIVLDEDHIEGLLRRERFLQALSAGPEKTGLPLWRVMDRRPLVVDADTPVEEVASQVTHRSEMTFHHDVLVARDSRYVGIVPVRALLEAMTTLQVNRAKYTDPLTGLPGNVLIEQTCNERLASGLPTAIVHAGIEHFRDFNLRQGPSSGDEAILSLARILRTALDAHGGEGSFLGHQGGDDFIVLTTPESAEAFCKACAREFDALAPKFRAAEPVVKGETPPLLALRMIGVNTRRRPCASLAEAMRVITPAERAASPRPRSHFSLL